MRRPFVTRLHLGDLVARTYENGDRDGPVIVLLHGIGMSHRYLARLHKALSPSARVISLDLPGYGSNPRPARPVAVEENARIAASALRSLGVDTCTLVGHSMGAQFATAVAIADPGLVSHLVLAGPVVDPRNRSVIRQALGLAVDTAREPFGANVLVLSDYLRCGVPWYLEQLRHMMNYPLEEHIRAVRMPVLVLRGDNDPIAPERWCRELANLAQDGAFAGIEGAAHVVQHSAPTEMAALIREFSTRTGDGRRG